MKKNLKCFLITFFIIAICSNYLHASDLKWNASTGEVTGYKIYYGISQGSYSFSEDVGNVTQYSLNNFSLSEGTLYYFVVRAYNAAGESGNSNVTTYTVSGDGDTTPPLSPVGASGVIENGNILLTWTPNSEPDISLYRVYYGTSSRNYGLPIPVVGTEYSLSGLNTDTTYYLAITAVDSSGNASGYSSPEIIKAITVAGESLPRPLLEWDAVTGDVSGYKIYYGTTAGNYTENIDVGDVTQYSLVNFQLTPGTPYYFTIKAYNAYGESGNSNAATYTIGELEDLVAPSVSIESPTTDPTYGTKSDSLNISGTASDAVGVTQVAWTNSMGGSGIATGTTSWSTAGITLAEGENVITVTVSDEAGNTSTDILTVVSTIPDTTAPAVSITLPTTETTFTTNQPTIEISGTASDNVGVTQVDWWSSAGAGGVAAGTVNWIVDTIYLIEGENVITITARDEAGNESIDTLTVVYTIPDTTAPVVRITSPTWGANYGIDSDKINIGGVASDDVGLNKIIWSNATGGSGIANGTESWSIEGISLVRGANLVTVTASDLAGNTSTGTLTVWYESIDIIAPDVTITLPTSGASYGTESNTLNIGGTASDAIGVSQVAWTNSRGGSGNATGTTSWSVAGIALAVGENIITVNVRDEAGNTSVETLTVTYTIPDTTAPAVTITSPTTGTTYATGSNTLNIGGAASDAISVTQVAWTNSRGGSGTATGTTSWSVAGIALAVGENVITVNVSDEAGNTSAETLTVTYTIPDTTAPAVTIMSPTTGITYATGSNSLNIGGTALDAFGVTQVAWSNSRGGSGTATGTTSWSVAGIALAVGENVITVNVRDEAGNTSAETLTVTYTIPDTTAPAVTIMSPTTGITYATGSNSLNLGGTASDAIGVTQVAWTNSRGGSGIATGTTSWSAAGIALGEGENVITVNVRDEAGNASTGTLTVEYTIPDTTAPAVTITSPTTGTTYATGSNSLNLGGTASDAIGVTQVAWTNSRGGSGNATGTTSWSATGIALAEGENVITVNVRDEVGNASTGTLTVVYTIPDTTAPAVTITSPTTGTTYATGSNSLNLGGTASDAIGVTRVAWSNSRGGSGNATGTTSWSVAGITLAEGENVITVTVSDEAGNTSVETLTVMYTIPDTTAPIVRITSPTWGANYGIDSDKINIGGVASDDVGLNKIIWSNATGGSGIANGTESWSIAGISLVRGANLVTVTASDSTGNTSTGTLTVWYEPIDIIAPDVTITLPTSGASYGTESNTLNIGGTASDAIGVTQVAWSNSRGGSGTATGTTSWSVAEIALGEGENVITVNVSDEAGNTSTGILTVVYTIPDTTAPAVTITSPTTDATFATGSNTLNIGGTASDAIGVTQVAWSNSRGGSGNATGTTSWSATGIALAVGENVITVNVRDEAGNTSVETLTVVYTMPDTTAPAVTITSPTTGTTFTTGSNTLNIGGTASDALGVTQVAWSNSRGGSGTATGTTSWSVAGIALAVGENVITVNVRDEAGNASTGTLTVVYTIPDTTAPAVTITSPTTGTTYATGSNSLNLGGTASDAIGVTQVAWTNSRGGSGTATGTTSWSVAGIALAEGENIITVNVRDEVGNTSVETLTVTYTIPDRTAPAVTITSPTTGTTYATGSNSLNLGGTASDAFGVTQVAWTNSRGGSGTATGTTSWSVAGIALAEGENIITVNVRDEVGNTSVETLTVTYTIPDRTAPAVTITSPTTGTTYATGSNSLNLGGTASDAFGVTQVAWTNSRGGSGTATGTTSWSVAGIALAEGENIITVNVRDEVGNTSVETLTVTYTMPDTTAPAVTITSPTTGTTYATGSNSLNLGGTASDAFGVTQVAWTNSRGGSGTATGTTSWSVAGIALAEGENIITVNVRDEVGNTSVETLTVTYTIPDTTAPAVSITSPTTGTTYATGSNTLNIGGTASDAFGVTQVAWSNSRGGSGTATGTTSWSVAEVALGEGENVITVNVRDEAGNTSAETLTVVYTMPDTTAPAVTITSPTTGTTYATGSNSLNLGGTASDAIGVTQVAWTNSRGGSGIATGTTSWSVAGITLAEGENVITVTVSDEAGNTSTDILAVEFTIPVFTDIQAPALQVNEPTTGGFFFTRQATVKFAGTASDNIRVKSVKWAIRQAGNGVASGTSNWEAASVPLARYWNNVTITAEDEAGNKTDYTFRIFSWR